MPITLLAIMAASSASPDIEEDFSNIGYLSHPEGDMVLYRVDGKDDELWNDMVEGDEPRHLEKRSPVTPFDPISKKYIAKSKAKKFLVKAIKFKPIWKPKAKKLAKKLAIVGIPTAALAGGTGLAGFALTSSLPALPALPAIPALGAAGAGAGLTNIPPFFPIPPLQPQQNRDRRRN